MKRAAIGQRSSQAFAARLVFEIEATVGRACHPDHFGARGVLLFMPLIHKTHAHL